MADCIVGEVQAMMDGNRHGFGLTVREAGNQRNWITILYGSREDADRARAVLIAALETALSIQVI